MKMTELAEELTRLAKTRGDLEVVVNATQRIGRDEVETLVPARITIEDVRQDIGGDFQWRALIVTH